MFTPPFSSEDLHDPDLKSFVKAQYGRLLGAYMLGLEHEAEVRTLPTQEEPAPRRGRRAA